MKKHIEVFDYVVIILILLVSISIGVYNGFRDRIINRIRSIFGKPTIQNDTIDNAKTQDYITANSSMSCVPVAFSILASFYSATALLGMPAEVYQYGVQFWTTSFSICLAPLIGAFISGPYLAKLYVMSIFEYLELRFKSKAVRLMGTLCYVLRNFISSSIYMYGPALSLSTLTGLNDKISILLIGFVGTIYTSIGGIRGVIWTDLFQAGIMILSQMVIIFKGIYDVGGVGNLFRINYEGGRMNFFDFNPDPFVRQSFWSLMIGHFIYFIIYYGFDQQMIQRFQAAKTKKLAQRALFLNVPGVFGMITICCSVGLIIYANYPKCDPLNNPFDKLKSPNQLVGYFVMDHLSIYPGLAGLFLSSLICGSLSSVSSSLGSQSVLIWQDIFKSISFFRRLNDTQSLIVNKLIVFVCGVLSTAFAFIIATFGGSLIQISLSLNGAINAPLVGLFLLGLFFPMINVIGAVVGTFTGLFAGLWLSYGAYITKPVYPKLTFSIEECFNDKGMMMSDISYANISTIIKPITPPNLTGFNKFYSLSYLYYTAFGTLVTITVGFLISIATGGLKNNTDESLLLYNLFGFLSRKKRDNKVDLVEKVEFESTKF